MYIYSVKTRKTTTIYSKYRQRKLPVKIIRKKLEIPSENIISETNQ